MPDDDNIALGIAQVADVLAGHSARPEVRSFFHEPTFTASYVVSDPATKQAAIIDSVLDFDHAAGRTSTASADAIADYMAQQGLAVEWLLETHVHADHLSGAAHLHDRLGGTVGIGRQVTVVQSSFADAFNESSEFRRDGSQFDHLFDDGERFAVGNIPALALHVPGHTPADFAYLIGDAIFVGDTMFMPDYGTARCDFPGGDARAMYRSIRRLMQLPDETRMFLCHDYKAPPARTEFAWETTIGEQRRSNVHIRDGISEEEFVAMRTARDRTLCMPHLIFPSVQVNIRGGRLPEAEANGTRYLKLPLDRF
jgi:glyoxylase-like metal-dependent hydrolase (beta-lactamase superfamily II)